MKKTLATLLVAGALAAAGLSAASAITASWRKLRSGLCSGRELVAGLHPKK